MQYLVFEVSPWALRYSPRTIAMGFTFFVPIQEVIDKKLSFWRILEGIWFYETKWNDASTELRGHIELALAPYLKVQALIVLFMNGKMSNGVAQSSQGRTRCCVA